MNERNMYIYINILMTYSLENDNYSLVLILIVINRFVYNN